MCKDASCFMHRYHRVGYTPGTQTSAQVLPDFQTVLKEQWVIVWGKALLVKFLLNSMQLWQTLYCKWGERTFNQSGQGGVFKQLSVMLPFDSETPHLVLANCHCQIWFAEEFFRFVWLGEHVKVLCGTLQEVCTHTFTHPFHVCLVDKSSL